MGREWREGEKRTEGGGRGGSRGRGGKVGAEGPLLWILDTPLSPVLTSSLMLCVNFCSYIHIF